MSDTKNLDSENPGTEEDSKSTPSGEFKEFPPSPSALIPFWSKMQRTGSGQYLHAGDANRRPSAMMMEAIMLAMANKQQTSTSTSLSTPGDSSGMDSASGIRFKSAPTTPSLDIPAPVFESPIEATIMEDVPSPSGTKVVSIPLKKLDAPPKVDVPEPLPPFASPEAVCQIIVHPTLERVEKCISQPSTPPVHKSPSKSSLQGLLGMRTLSKDRLPVPKFLRQLSKDKGLKDTESKDKEKKRKSGDAYVSSCNSEDELYDAISSSTPLMKGERRPSTQLPSEMILKNGEWQIPSSGSLEKGKSKTITISPVVVTSEKDSTIATASPEASSTESTPASSTPSKEKSCFTCKSMLKFPAFCAEKRRDPAQWDLLMTKIFVAFLFLCIMSSLVTYYVFYGNRQSKRVVGEGLHFYEAERKVDYLRPSSGKLMLHGSIGKSLSNSKTEPLPCLPEGELPGDSVCLEWKHKARLHLTYSQQRPGISCYGTAWEDLRARPGPMTDCFDASGAAWYGAGDGVPYPMNKAKIGFRPFVSGVFGRTIVRRLWLNSNGVLFAVPQTVPLFVSINHNEYKSGFFCVRSDNDNRYYKSNHNRTAWLHTAGPASLNYTVCVGDNLREIHDFLNTASQAQTSSRQKVPLSRSKMKPKKSQQSTPAPVTSPPASKVGGGRLRNGYFYRPTRSSNATDQPIFNQEHLLEMTAKLNASGVNHAWVILDYQWQGKIGDFVFDHEAFPNVTNMIEVLRNQGFNLGLEITPFISVNSKAFRRGLTSRLLVQDKATPLPALTQFRDMKSAAVLDPTTNDTQRWFVQKLRSIGDMYNITHFVLDAGRSDELPPSGHFSIGLPNPDLRIDYFVEAIRKADVKLLALTPAPETMDNNCILHREVLNFSQPSQLQHLAHSVLNAVTLQVRCLMVVVEVPYADGGAIPKYSHKLMQRWLQLASILPRSSFWPWLPMELNKALEEYRNVTSITTLTNRPRNRLPAPMWTVSDEPDFHWIGDQFAMGPSDFVAPILGEQKFRDVLLPKGIWIDNIKHQALAGPKHLSKFKLDFKDILYFTCISTDSMHDDEIRVRHKDKIKRKERWSFFEPET